MQINAFYMLILEKIRLIEPVSAWALNPDILDKKIYLKWCVLLRYANECIFWANFGKQKQN